MKRRKCKREIKPKERHKQSQDGRVESSGEGAGGSGKWGAASQAVKGFDPTHWGVWTVLVVGGH